MRTKWQSSTIVGDTIDSTLKGNRQIGDILIVLLEIKLDLSRKFNFLHCHLFYFWRINKLFFNKSKMKKVDSKSQHKWFIFIGILAILICGSFELLSDLLLRNVGIIAAIIILIFIIAIGVIFDIIGIAATAASETPFHAKASKKVPEAKIALILIKNASKVATVCNDVVGDVSGIVSGSVGAMLVIKVMLISKNINETVIAVFIGTVIGTITIVGKSCGKSFAMENSDKIIFKVAKILYIFKKDR